jgi:hypothetical protein
MTEQDPNIQGDGTHEPTPYVTAEIAWEMSKRAAAEARAEAIKEAQSQMQYSGGTEDNKYTQDSRQTQDNIRVQDNIRTQDNRQIQDSRDYRRDRDDDYDDRVNRRRRRKDDDDEDEDLVGFSPRLIKQLQTTVGVFNTLKDFSSNPMQKAIEDRIGGLAAGIIENAFSSPRGPPPKRDMIDTILNSQMAFGLGQGLGSRAPELVETLSKSFGKEKAENMIEGMIGKYGGGGGGEQRKIESGNRDNIEKSEPSPPSPAPQKPDDQSNIELLLSLDPNNPEHVAAYSESQGGISIDVARKMLMIHQDDIIKRMKSQGADTTVIESQRGSRIGQDNPSQRSTMDQDITPISEPRPGSQVHRVEVAPNYQTPPVQHAPYVPQPPPAQRTLPVEQMSHIQQQQPIQREYLESVPRENITQEYMQYTEPDLENISEDKQKEDQQKQDREYAEYNDVGKSKRQERNVDQTSSNNQQTEMMKAFADDIGKVMGDVIGKIEGLNNTVFSLQTELNEIKKQKTQQVPVQSLEQRPLQQEPTSTKDLYSDNFERESMHIRDSFQEEIQEPMPIIDSFQEGIKEQIPIRDSFQEGRQEPMSTKDFFPDDFERESEESKPDVKDMEELKPKIQEEKEQEIQDVKEKRPKTQNTIDFFHEKVQNIHDFERELEEETRRTVQSMKKESIDETQKNHVENKEIEIVKKPIISMVNKKKVNYVPKQKGDVSKHTNKEKGDEIQSENKEKETKEDNKIIENSGKDENSENNNNMNIENSESDKSGKDDIHNDGSKD